MKGLVYWQLFCKGHMLQNVLGSAFLTTMIGPTWAKMPIRQVELQTPVSLVDSTEIVCGRRFVTVYYSIPKMINLLNSTLFCQFSWFYSKNKKRICLSKSLSFKAAENTN